MNAPTLYRRRLIPSETLLLKDDVILYHDEHRIVTRWSTIRPKKDLHHGFSCYLLDKDVKVNKFYNHNHELICWQMYLCILTAVLRWWIWMRWRMPWNRDCSPRKCF